MAQLASPVEKWVRAVPSVARSRPWRVAGPRVPDLRQGLSLTTHTGATCDSAIPDPARSFEYRCRRPPEAAAPSRRVPFRRCPAPNACPRTFSCSQVGCVVIALTRRLRAGPTPSWLRFSSPGMMKASMGAPVTVLWLIDRADVPAHLDERFRHVVGDPRAPAATIVRLLLEGPLLAVVSNDDDGQRAIAYGVDEVVLAAEVGTTAFDRIAARTAVRAQARLNRDQFLIDLVRKDDTAAIELLSAALGEKLIAPLALAAAESSELAVQLGTADAPLDRARRIADTVAAAAGVVEKMRELVPTERSDEVVDLAQIAREVSGSLAAAVKPVASFDVSIASQACHVGMPRWQVAVMVASLIANAVDSVASHGDGARTVSVRVSTEQNAALLEVADNGHGVDGDQRPSMADPFFTTSAKSLGLGLTLVSARVRRAGGELMIESDPEIGTTVRVFLPLVGGVHLEPPRN